MIIGLLSLMLLFLVHEGGHLIAAVATGIPVVEFSIGIGPSLLAFHWRNTAYVLRAVPLGAYVALGQGDDDEARARFLLTTPIRARLVTIASGPLANLLIAGVLLAGVHWLPQVAMRRSIIRSVPVPLERLADEERLCLDEAMEEWRGRLQREPVLRNDDVVRVQPGQTADRRGATYLIYGPREPRVIAGRSIRESVRASVRGVREGVVDSTSAVTSIGLGRSSWRELQGPVGISHMIGRYGDHDLRSYLRIVSFSSIGMAVFNLMPLPILDGGRLLFLLLEGATGRRPPKRLGEWMDWVGILLMLLLFIALTGSDVLRYFGR